MADCEGYTYLSEVVLSGNALDKKSEKPVVAALTKAVKQAVQQGKGLEWKQPTSKQHGFALAVKLKLNLKQKGKQQELQAQATVSARLVPSQVKVLVLSPGPKTFPLADASAIGDSAASCVHGLAYDLMKKQVVKVLVKHAAESGKG